MSFEDAPLRLAIDRDVAIVEIDNPPVNALFDTIRDGIASLMQGLNADPAIAAILFVGAGRAFSAGVDLKRTAQRAEPFFFHAALDAMDAVAKPLIAAIQGPALGGGLELALTCDYRLAGPAARFGLPEVEVGIIPGACGTQRLPRLIPLDRALGVAALGDILDAKEALALGLVDAVTDRDDFRNAAIEWAREHAGAPRRRTRDRPVRVSGDFGPAIEAAKRRAAAERPGESAPLKAIEAVRAGCASSFDEGVAAEKRLVTECKNSSEAKAMRHLFFAERAAGKIAASPRLPAAVTLQGSQGGALAERLRAAGVALSENALPLYVVRPEEDAPEDAITIVPPDTASGIVELTAPSESDEAVLAGLVKLVRPLGRAVVIGRGCRLGHRLREIARSAGGDNRTFPPHVTAALAEAGAALVASGAAASEGDVDLVCVAALGFPRALGGPLYQRGLGQI